MVAERAGQAMNVGQGTSAWLAGAKAPPPGQSGLDQVEDALLAFLQGLHVRLQEAQAQTRASGLGQAVAGHQFLDLVLHPADPPLRQALAGFGQLVVDDLKIGVDGVFRRRDPRRKPCGRALPSDDTRGHRPAVA